MCKRIDALITDIHADIRVAHASLAREAFAALKKDARLAPPRTN